MSRAALWLLRPSGNVAAAKGAEPKGKQSALSTLFWLPQRRTMATFNTDEPCATTRRDTTIKMSTQTDTHMIYLPPNFHPHHSSPCPRSKKSLCDAHGALLFEFSPTRRTARISQTAPRALAITTSFTRNKEGRRAQPTRIDLPQQQQQQP